MHLDQTDSHMIHVNSMFLFIMDFGDSFLVNQVIAVPFDLQCAHDGRFICHEGFDVP
jgi:hypothetical protein